MTKVYFPHAKPMPSRIALGVAISERHYDDGDLVASCRLFHSATGLFVETYLYRKELPQVWNARRMAALYRLHRYVTEASERN